MTRRHTIAPHLLFNMIDDPVRAIEEMADLQRKLILLRYDGTTLRQIFERIDRLHQPAKPTFRCFGFFLDITNKPDVLFRVGERRLSDVNLECQVSPEVLRAPALQV